MLIEYDDLIRCNIGPGGDLDSFRFEGGSGETVLLEIGVLGLGAACFQLLAPNGLPVDIVSCTGSDFVLAQTGTYTVVTSGVGEAGIDYALALERIGPTPTSAVPIQFDQTIEDEITQGDIDVLFFAAAAGATVRVQASTTTVTVGLTCIQVFAPDGSPLGDETCALAGSQVHRLQMTGRHSASTRHSMR